MFLHSLICFQMINMIIENVEIPNAVSDEVIYKEWMWRLCAGGAVGGGGRQTDVWSTQREWFLPLHHTRRLRLHRLMNHFTDVTNISASFLAGEIMARKMSRSETGGLLLFFLSFSVSVVVRLTFERYYVECSSYSKVEQTEFITKATGRKVVFLFFTKFPPWGWLIWPHLIRLLLHLKCWNSITLLLWVWCCLCFLWYTDLRAKQTQLKNPQ